MELGRGKGQSAIEYILIIAIVVSVLTLVWFFLFNTKSESGAESGKRAITKFVDLERGTEIGSAIQPFSLELLKLSPVYGGPS